MKQKEEKITARIHVDVKPKPQFLFGYPDIYPGILVEVSRYMAESDKSEILKLAGEDSVEATAEFKYSDFIKIQDQLSQKLAEKAKRLEDELNGKR